MLNEVERNPRNLRVITTARTHVQIAQGIVDGYTPLYRKVEPTRMFRQKNGDFRSSRDLTWEYPYENASGTAAYMLPTDLRTNEYVWIEDLIEHFVGATWNQGDVFRLQSSEAIWTGTDIMITPPFPEEWIG